MPFSPIGHPIQDLDTPALLIDLDKLDRNIARMAKRCANCGVDWRPHTKGHKTPAIAHKVISAGAIGITCAKLGEAEVMAASGVRDILVANQVVGEQKVARLAALQRHADVMVAVDHEAHLESIGQAALKVGVSVRVLIEVNIGLDRSGVSPGKETADLAKKAVATEGITFAGLMGYEGHAMALPDPEKKVECERAIALLNDAVQAVEHAGLKVGIVSAGGTGTLSYTPDLPGVTEIQAGGGVMMDTFYEKKLGVRGQESALTLLATVVSHSTPDRAITDAGRKTVHGAYQMPEAVGRPDIEVVGLSAEHGILHLDGTGPKLEIGQKLEFVSGYSDMTVFLHDTLYGVREGRVETVWDIQGRGKLH